MSGAGGGGFANVFTEDKKSFLFDFFCNTPKYKKPIEEVDFYPINVNFGTVSETFHIGNGATGVPGTIAGMFAIHENLGTLPMKDLVRPAIQMAKDGGCRESISIP